MLKTTRDNLTETLEREWNRMSRQEHAICDRLWEHGPTWFAGAVNPQRLCAEGIVFLSAGHLSLTDFGVAMMNNHAPKPPVFVLGSL